MINLVFFNWYFIIKWIQTKSRKCHKSKVLGLLYTIAAKYDTMDPQHIKWISEEVQNGRFLFCPNGSHCSQFNDQKTYFLGLIKFLKDVDNDSFKKLINEQLLIFITISQLLSCLI